MGSPEESEEVDGIVVLSEERHEEVVAAPERPGLLASGQVGQTAAVAAAGFVAGAAVAGALSMRRRAASGSSPRRRRIPGRGAQKSKGVGEMVQIIGSRSLLLDVHLLDGGPGRR